MEEDIFTAQYGEEGVSRSAPAANTHNRLLRASSEWSCGYVKSSVVRNTGGRSLLKFVVGGADLTCLNVILPCVGRQHTATSGDILREAI